MKFKTNRTQLIDRSFVETIIIEGKYRNEKVAGTSRGKREGSMGEIEMQKC